MNDSDRQQAQEERVQKLWKILNVADHDSLDLADLKGGLRRLNHPLKDSDTLIKAVLNTLDANHDGRIQYNEFRAFVEGTENELFALFQSIDRDHNGQLDRKEIGAAFEKAGLSVSSAKLDHFFQDIDKNHDGSISFEEWRDFLLFIPTHDPSMRAVLSYYTDTYRIGPEGDPIISNEHMGLGTLSLHFTSLLFGVIADIARPPPKPRPPSESMLPPPVLPPLDRREDALPLSDSSGPFEISEHASKAGWRSLLTELLPSPGYFMAGAISGVASRTTTAPLDRLRVYLIAQTGSVPDAVNAAKDGKPLQAARASYQPLVQACKELWKAGGIRSLFAGNGLNVVKVAPESAVKFGSYEATKRVFAHMSGHDDVNAIHPWSKFVAGGIAGIVSQFAVYPIDTLKFRMQCETVEGGPKGNVLIAQVARKMWREGGFRPYYRGLSLGLVGIFPYASLDLGTYEYVKRWIAARNAQRLGINIEDDAAQPGPMSSAVIGGFSGALGASIVYPINLLRTRLQSQGTVIHPRTYTGIMDVTRQTLRGEGWRGLFKGLTPNLLKVVPAVSITYVTYEQAKKMMNLH